MGTILYEGDGLQIKKFYGGSKRGVCIQITTGEDFIQLTRPQFVELSKAILHLVIRDTLERIFNVKL